MTTSNIEGTKNVEKIRLVQRTVTTVIYTPDQGDREFYDDEGVTNIDMAALREAEAVRDKEFGIADVNMVVPGGGVQVETEVEVKIVTIDEKGFVVGMRDPDKDNISTDHFFEKVSEEPEED